ncbi:CYTH domain-containing protein [Salinicola rhizosphaerae]|uniref:CYTH domain-containing protein n=1 Tax=Salinicola rhizosphaerae TaxID=1443141 RepID=A0ABQ3DZN2_9GAMM|nr:CYTH domain-containing protein [Salinicola rhizosphaerae]GHB20851.1 hypothetical protein GCM10009038_19580 [Salinicola rhizosphaerae]
MSDEIEIKLALAPSAVDALIAHPLLSRCESQTIALGNQYYDSEDGALQSRRIALRVRRQGETCVQTLKSAAASQSGLSTRGEWEWPITSARRNAAGLDIAGLEALSHPALADVDLARLAPVFTTDFDRRSWRYREGESDIEVALDRGEIRVGDRLLPICELELELKAGDADALWMLAERLCQTSGPGVEQRALAARPANHSKASRAAHLAQGWGAPAANPAPTLDDLIEAIDSWQDSGDERWQHHALALGEALFARLPAALQAHGKTVLADIRDGQIPFHGAAWLALRRALS